MPIDANIYGQQIQPRFNTPFENLSGILQLRNQQELAKSLEEQRLANAEERRQKAEELQQHQADLAAIDAAVKGGKTAEEVVALTPGHLQAMMRKQFADADKYNADAKESKAKAEKDELAYAANLASSVKAWKPYGPDAMLNAAQVALQTAKAHGHDVSQLEGVLSQDPTKLEPMLDGIIAQFQGPPKPEADYTIGNTRFQGGTNKPLVTAPKEPTKPASAQEFEYRNSLSPEQRAEYDRYQTDDANRKRPVTNINAGATPGGEALSTDAVPYLATQYRILGAQGIPTRLSDVDKRAIINEAAKQTKALGQSPAQAVQKQAAFKSDAKSLDKMSTMKSAAEAYEAKAAAQGQLARDLSNKVDRTAIPIINDVIIGIKKNTGDEKSQLYVNALTTFAAEYAKIMEGSTGSVAAASDSARKAAFDLIRAGLNKGQISKTIDQMQWEMDQTLKGYDATIEHITNRMGGGPTNPQMQQQTGTESGDHRYWRLNGKQGPEPK
jgi:hypothetical protein